MGLQCHIIVEREKLKEKENCVLNIVKMEEGINTDILCDVEDCDLPIYSDIYREHELLSYAAPCISIGSKINKRHPEFKKRFLAPLECGTIFVITEIDNIYEIAVFTDPIMLTPGDESVRSCLNQTRKINFNTFNRTVVFRDVSRYLRPLVNRFIESRNLEVELDREFHVFRMPKEVALESELRIPDGVRLRPLDPNNAYEIIKRWPYYFPRREPYIRTLLLTSGGIGLFSRADGELLSWGLLTTTGTIGYVQTLKKAQRRGYASFIVRFLAMELANRDEYPVVMVSGNDYVPYIFFEDLGFQINGKCHNIHLQMDTLERQERRELKLSMEKAYLRRRRQEIEEAGPLLYVPPFKPTTQDFEEAGPSSAVRSVSAQECTEDESSSTVAPGSMSKKDIEDDDELFYEVLSNPSRKDTEKTEPPSTALVSSSNDGTPLAITVGSSKKVVKEDEPLYVVLSPPKKSKQQSGSSFAVPSVSSKKAIKDDDYLVLSLPKKGTKETDSLSPGPSMSFNKVKKDVGHVLLSPVQDDITEARRQLPVMSDYSKKVTQEDEPLYVVLAPPKKGTKEAESSVPSVSSKKVIEDDDYVVLSPGQDNVTEARTQLPFMSDSSKKVTKEDEPLYVVLAPPTKGKKEAASSVPSVSSKKVIEDDDYVGLSPVQDDITEARTQLPFMPDSSKKVTKEDEPLYVVLAPPKKGTKESASSVPSVSFKKVIEDDDYVVLSFPTKHIKDSRISARDSLGSTSKNNTDDESLNVVLYPHSKGKKETESLLPDPSVYFKKVIKEASATVASGSTSKNDIKGDVSSSSSKDIEETKPSTPSTSKKGKKKAGALLAGSGSFKKLLNEDEPLYAVLSPPKKVINEAGSLLPVPSVSSVKVREDGDYVVLSPPTQNIKVETSATVAHDSTFKKNIENDQTSSRTLPSRFKEDIKETWRSLPVPSDPSKRVIKEDEPLYSVLSPPKKGVEEDRSALSIPFGSSKKATVLSSGSKTDTEESRPLSVDVSNPFKAYVDPVQEKSLASAEHSSEAELTAHTGATKRDPSKLVSIQPSKTKCNSKSRLIRDVSPSVTSCPTTSSLASLSTIACSPTISSPTSSQLVASDPEANGSVSPPATPSPSPTLDVPSPKTPPSNHHQTSRSPKISPPSTSGP